MINGSLYNLAKLKKTKHSTEIFLKQRDPTTHAGTNYLHMEDSSIVLGMLDSMKI